MKHMRFTQHIALLACLLATAGLATALESAGSVPVHPLQIITDPALLEMTAREPVDVLDIQSLPNGRMRVDVAYNGGCAKHSLDLITDGKIIYTSTKRGRFAKPGILRTRIAHDKNGDTCNAVVLETLVFDLSPVETIAEETEVVAIHLGASDKRILYHFKEKK